MFIKNTKGFKERVGTSLSTNLLSTIKKVHALKLKFRLLLKKHVCRQKVK